MLRHFVNRHHDDWDQYLATRVSQVRLSVWQCWASKVPECLQSFRLTMQDPAAVILKSLDITVGTCPEDGNMPLHTWALSLPCLMLALMEQALREVQSCCLSLQQCHLSSRPDVWSLLLFGASGCMISVPSLSGLAKLPACGRFQGKAGKFDATSKRASSRQRCCLFCSNYSRRATMLTSLAASWRVLAGC